MSAHQWITSILLENDSGQRLFLPIWDSLMLGHTTMLEGISTMEEFDIRPVASP